MTSQRQQGGDHSTNLQAQTVIYHAGISMADARDIAQDVYRANALEMAGLARSIAAERCEQWSENFLLKLCQVSPKLLSVLQDPDIQHALFSAQRDFARSGDEQLGESLAELLVLRCQTNPQTLERLVLNEAISTVPKLTHVQVNILTLIWYLTQTVEPNVVDVSGLSRVWARAIEPLLDGMTKSKANLEHLTYAGCVNIRMGTHSIWELAMDSYGQLFSLGLSEDRIPSELTKYWTDERIFRPCLRDPRLKRVAQRLEFGFDLPNNDSFDLGQLRTGNYLDRAEFVEEVAADFPDFVTLCDLWDNSLMSYVNLSTVGIAIAHSNSGRIHGPDENPGLEVWLGAGAQD